MAPSESNLNISSRVQEIVKKQSFVAPPMISRISFSKINTPILAVVILFLALSTLTVFVVKKQTTVAKKPDHIIERIKEHVVPANMATKEDLAELDDRLNGRMDKAEKRIGTWGNRVWLLGIAHNENVNLMRSAEQKRYGTHSDYIVFDGDWKINHMPNTMDIEDLKEDLKKNLK